MGEGLCGRECGVIFDVAPESLVSLSGGARGQSSKVELLAKNTC